MLHRQTTGRGERECQSQVFDKIIGDFHRRPTGWKKNQERQHTTVSVPTALVEEAFLSKPLWSNFAGGVIKGDHQAIF
jgi:hypothetical protein